MEFYFIHCRVVLYDLSVGFAIQPQFVPIPLFYMICGSLLSPKQESRSRVAYVLFKISRSPFSRKLCSSTLI